MIQLSWDKNTIKPKHNCYSYALNHKFAKRKGKAQPGYFSGYKNVPDGKYNCDTFYKRISDDSPSLFLTTFEYQHALPVFIKVLWLLIINLILIRAFL